ncbi:hypothetical protein KFK09_002275 [Dendrobium nobile]|uniref:Uncharacterized protein n=1 Tax=Dendrobium nobile TaxID=94219 RepID=A0A8T3C9R6_DENNO|nr:hypothetical protein KFK09_002275 [Dendrobium nobile]
MPIVFMILWPERDNIGILTFIIYFSHLTIFWRFLCRHQNNLSGISFNDSKVTFFSYSLLYSYYLQVFGKKTELKGTYLLFLFWVLSSISPSFSLCSFCTRRKRIHRLIGFCFLF